MKRNDDDDDEDGDDDDADVNDRSDYVWSDDDTHVVLLMILSELR